MAERAGARLGVAKGAVARGAGEMAAVRGGEMAVSDGERPGPALCGTCSAGLQCSPPGLVP